MPGVFRRVIITLACARVAAPDGRAELQSEFDAVYGARAINITAASPGTWSPTADCAAPRLWILLYGHVRTFPWTQANLGEVATRSSGGCFIVAALVPEEIDVLPSQQRTRSSRAFWAGFDAERRTTANASRPPNVSRCAARSASPRAR